MQVRVALGASVRLATVNATVWVAVFALLLLLLLLALALLAAFIRRAVWCVLQFVLVRVMLCDR